MESKIKNYMENYILLKDLPDTSAGTKVIWCEGGNFYYYNKSGAYVAPHDKGYFTAGQVTQNPEWFEVDKIFTVGEVKECINRIAETMPVDPYTKKSLIRGCYKQFGIIPTINQYE